MGRNKIPDTPFKREYEATRKQGKAYESSPSRATAARYDRVQKRLAIELANGGELRVPVRLVPELRDATDDQIAEVELWKLGTLHWEALDVDLSVTALVEETLGAKLLMSAVGRRGGRTKSEAKARAARANGLKGGRPKSQ